MPFYVIFANNIEIFLSIIQVTPTEKYLTAVRGADLICY
jgi:hypothetical protein